MSECNGFFYAGRGAAYYSSLFMLKPKVNTVFMQQSKVGYVYIREKCLKLLNHEFDDLSNVVGDFIIDIETSHTSSPDQVKLLELQQLEYNQYIDPKFIRTM